MTAIQDVVLVKEESNPAVYLVVGSVKFWIVDPPELFALGFDFPRVRIVPDHTLDALVEKRLHAPQAARPSDRFFDCGVDDPDSLTGALHFNCLPSASLIRRDVLIAGWLKAAPFVNFPNSGDYGIEDVHYDVWLDQRFLERMYGVGGLSTALNLAVLPGNPPAPHPLPFGASPVGQDGSRAVTMNSWILPTTTVSWLHCELNAWQEHDTGVPFSRHFVGRGTPPAFWVNPLAVDDNAWFPFDPLRPDGADPLRAGEYVVLRGVLWQDTGHTDPAAVGWNSGETFNHNGWLEIHPVDWVVRATGPSAHSRVTVQALHAIAEDESGPAPIWPLSVVPDFAASSESKRLQVRRCRTLIDDRITVPESVQGFSFSSALDHVVLSGTVAAAGGKQGRFKGCCLVEWREIDTLDRHWINDALPPGASPFENNESWDWSAETPEPYIGTLLHRSALIDGMHQHAFMGANPALSIASSETLFSMVWLDPGATPDEIMLQWRAKDWEHRAYWGANMIDWGVDGTASRRYMGPLPRAGEWVRLEVPAASVNLEGALVDGMAFTLWNGRAYWDYAGVKASGLRLGGLVITDSQSEPIERWEPTPLYEGSAMPTAVLMTNRSGRSVQLRDVQIISSQDAPGDPVFTVLAAFPLDVAESTLLTLPVEFKAKQSGPVTGVITVACDDEALPQFSVSLSTSVLPIGEHGELQVMPTSIDFGARRVGETVGQEITLTNTGTRNVSSVDLRVADSHPGAQFAVSAARSTLLAPGQSDTVGVTCTPTARGSLRATLTIDARSDSSSLTPYLQHHEITLGALAQAPVIFLAARMRPSTPLLPGRPASDLWIPDIFRPPSPPSGPVELELQTLDFGIAPPGGRGSASFWVRNLGDLPLNLQGVEIVGQSNFGVTDGSTFPATVAPGGECQVPCDFLAPVQAGAIAAGRFRVASDDPARPMAELQVRGRAAGPHLSEPSELLEMGAGSPPLPVTLSFTSDGSDPVTIKEIALVRGTDFILTGVPALPLQLAPGGILTLGVACTAPQSGQCNDTLVLLHDGKASRRTQVLLHAERV